MVKTYEPIIHIQLLVLKYHSPLKGTRSGAGNVQDESGTSCCPREQGSYQTTRTKDY